jgi:hypothetical protein
VPGSRAHRLDERHHDLIRDLVSSSSGGGECG